MANQPLKGAARLKAALTHSRDGFHDAWQDEEAFRTEFVVFVLAVPVALWLGETGREFALLICSLMLLLIVELLNSAIEAVVDRIGPEWHELSRKAKDLGSLAVLIATMIPAMIWGMVVLDRCGIITF